MGVLTFGAIPSGTQARIDVCSAERPYVLKDGEAARRKVLFVEDDASIRPMPELSLQPRYSVRVAEAGLAGLESAKEQDSSV